MEESGTPSRITVSRDALRADLAEMELRLRVYFDDQLKHKADKSELHTLMTRVSVLETVRVERDRGDFTPAQLRAVEEQIENAQDAHQDRGWTTRERLMATAAFGTGIVTFMMSVALALHGGGV